jgi:hypothetical protein
MLRVVLTKQQILGIARRFGGMVFVQHQSP